jgi:hypothetical protein
VPGKIPGKNKPSPTTLQNSPLPKQVATSSPPVYFLGLGLPQVVSYPPAFILNDIHDMEGTSEGL